MGVSVINSPETIHAFRMAIAKIIDGLNEQLAKTEHSIEQVSAGWNDGKFEKFKENFSEDQELIVQLGEILENYDNIILQDLEQKLIAYVELKNKMYL